jgi:TrmH family RNA methyltransferase
MTRPREPAPPLLANPRAERVRAVARLGRRVARERAGAFTAEGPQAVREAVQHGRVRALYVTTEAAERYVAEVTAARARGVEPVPVTDEVMTAMTDTVTPQGLLAVCDLVDRPLDEVLAGRPALVAVLAHVRDPGNAGTVLRAADAAGAGAVVLSEASVDVHNPKCVRSTAGSLFHLPVCQGRDLADVVDALHAQDVVVLAADGAGDLDLDALLDAADDQTRARADGSVLPGADGSVLPGPTALLLRPTAWLLGNEAWGLPPEHRALADAVVRIPLQGRAESLNLAMAATVCLFASARAQTGAARRRSVRSDPDR